MKKALFLVAALAGFGYAACSGPYCYDDAGGSMTGVIWSQSGPVALSSTTIAARTPGRIGDVVLCNTCTSTTVNGYTVCIATSTTPPAYMTVSSSTRVCN
jgi:hypothetical protein